MEVTDFAGSHEMEHDDELLRLLRSARRGPYGAFILSHGGDESLWIHFNGDAAFLCFFPRERHPGFVPDRMWRTKQEPVKFLQVNDSEADAIWVNWDQLVTIDDAYRAAIEFLHSPSIPATVAWSEL